MDQFSTTRPGASEGNSGRFGQAREGILVASSSDGLPVPRTDTPGNLATVKRWSAGNPHAKLPELVAATIKHRERAALRLRDRDVRRAVEPVVRRGYQLVSGVEVDLLVAAFQ